MKRSIICITICSVALALAGCGNSRMRETEAWMQEERNKTRPAVKPLPEPKPYTAVNYMPPAGVEPFSVDRLLQAISAANASSPASALYRSVAEGRRKQPLEAYPLDTMHYVGMLQKDGRVVALIKVDNLLYQIRVGDFMGQNFGRVTSIKESQVALREVVQDAVGEWIERDTTLNLQEGSK
ncbi:MAG: pilus assembly protein PilP [Brachymonas sp.]|nr:pilus assembly protein PilP [Brachymonas sp.]